MTYEITIFDETRQEKACIEMEATSAGEVKELIEAALLVRQQSREPGQD